MDNISENICRLCLKESEYSLEVFSEEGIQLNIATIVSQHFWFEIKENEHLFNIICTTCWCIVKKFNDFYLSVLNAHNLLAATNSITSTSVEEITVVPVTLYNIKDDDEYCPDILGNETNQLEDEVTEYDTVDSEEQDEICNDVENNYDEVSDSNVPQESPKKTISKPERQRNKTKTLEEDAKIQEFFVITCHICSESFSRFPEIKKHYRDSHSVNGYITCCNKKFFRRSRVIEHINVHLNPEAFKCDLCNKVYADKQGLTHHMNNHIPNEDRPFKCNQCQRRYTKQFQLDQHQIRHNQSKDFICDECGKAFSSKSIVQTHKRVVHEGVYRRMCDICSKVLKSKTFFDKHRLEHEENKQPRVQCQLCGKWLKHKHSLRSHMVRHEDSNLTYSCNICGKQSPNRGALQSHMKYVHGTEKSFKCSVCDKAFKLAVGLKEHMTIHTGEVLYTCPHCPKTFNSGANMHSHRKKSHTKEWEESRNLNN